MTAVDANVACSSIFMLCVVVVKNIEATIRSPKNIFLLSRGEQATLPKTEHRIYCYLINNAIPIKMDLRLRL